MVDVTTQKCACPDCVCVVAIADAVKKDDQNYCSEICANGHAGAGAGCGHPGCRCKG